MHPFINQSKGEDEQLGWQRADCSGLLIIARHSNHYTAKVQRPLELIKIQDLEKESSEGINKQIINKLDNVTGF